MAQFEIVSGQKGDGTSLILTDGVISSSGGATPSLQQVTDVGNTTTDSVTIGTTNTPTRNLSVDGAGNVYMSFNQAGAETYAVGSEPGVRPYLIYDTGLGQYTLSADTSGNINIPNQLSFTTDFSSQKGSGFSYLFLNNTTQTGGTEIRFGTGSPNFYTTQLGQSSSIATLTHFYLPSTDGSAGQFVVGDGAGNNEYSSILPTVDFVAATGQGADIGTTNFANTSVSGIYRVSVYIFDSTADLTAGAVNVTIAYTDDSGAQTITVGPTLLTTLGAKSQATLFVETASGSISYAVSHTGIFGTGKYNIYATVERLK